MNEFTVILDKLATKLGVATEYLWGTLVSMAPAYGAVAICHLALAIAGIVAVYFVGKCFWKKIDSLDNDEYPTFLFKISLCLPGFPIIMDLCQTIMDCVKEIILAFFIPQAWALQFILENVRHVAK